LYNLREVEQVRAMRAACDGGMSAAEAARWAQAERDGQEAPPALPTEDVFASAQRGLIDAVERFDDVALEARLRQTTFMGQSTVLLDRIVAPTLHEIGRRWHAGELSIAQEHLASQRIGKLLRDLMQLATSANGAARVVLGSFADDEHELGLLGLGLRLSTWGYRPIFLGARTPPGAIRNAVEAVSPSLVALSVTQTPERARARELVEEYASACGRVPWLVGGAGAAPIADLVRAHGGLVDPGEPEALRAMIRKEAKAGK
jgi:methanogenic corrinoid protein MtbC1